MNVIYCKVTKAGQGDLPGFCAESSATRREEGPAAHTRDGPAVTGSRSSGWRGLEINREVTRLVAKKHIDWAAIQAEYIGGNIGQARLAKKHGIAFGTLRNRAKVEGWYAAKQAAIHEIGIKSAQKTADIAAENAVRAQRIKTRLLEKLEALMEEQLKATEAREYDDHDRLVAIHRLRDLTSAYKDLTGDMPKAEAGDDALRQAREILGGVDSAIE